MMRINWQWSTLLVTLAITNFPVLPAMAQAQQYPSSSYLSASRPWWSWWPGQNDRTRVAWGPRRGGGVRRGEVCAISPGLMEEVNMIWSDRPVFVWQGNASQLILRDFSTKEVLWSLPIDATTQSVVYDGAALQPGQTYQWQLLNAADDPTQVPWFMFQVIEPTQRASIATELASIEQQAGLSAEAIALQKAEYFAEKGLWSDTLQALYSVNPPAPAVTEAIQAIVNEACPTQNTPTHQNTPTQ